MSTKRKINILIGVLVVSILWGATQYSQKIGYKRHLDAQYQRMFYELMGNVETIQSDLSKVNVSTSTKQNVIILTDIMNQSYSAQEKMSQLPLNHRALGKTEKFLTQVGDYTVTLAKEALDDKNLNEKERKKLYELQKNAQYLSEELGELQTSIAKGKVEFFDIVTKSNKKLKKTNKSIMATSMIRIEERMSETPELIYDGPFSEHIGNIKPRLKGKKIDKNKAKEIAINFLKEKNISDLTYDGRVKNSTIPGYVFKNNNISMVVSETGGKIVWMIDTRNVKEPTLKKGEALKIAKDFLDKKGYKDMVPTYSLRYDGTTTFNFSYKQENVTIYPDLIKIKVALDSGEVVGFESQGYLVSHYNREINTPKVSADEASKSIIRGAKILKSKLAIIPTEGKKEKLCYEFRVEYENRNFLIYVDAITGKQQKIFELIKNENGTLTM
ncbi:germination protein YpeB [Tepidibacter formicigenes]|uniref:Germination protein YpeB n=1 Tax=Tepidibacter formicigenes DSM 15518 TaxID=1123349 RepID=A0A1M6SVA0_9FIRM|nr:germination protein YpeB [Tepidibacter formicigenes]SHK48651.1 germination protein YpeB [Tepidibacter formicigenes DSM 15518]